MTCSEEFRMRDLQLRALIKSSADERGATAQRHWRWQTRSGGVTEASLLC